MYMISVQGVGEAVSVVKYNVIGHQWEGVGGGLSRKCYPYSVGIENEILSICEFLRKSFFSQKGLKCKIN